MEMVSKIELIRTPQEIQPTLEQKLQYTLSALQDIKQAEALLAENDVYPTFLTIARAKQNIGLDWHDLITQGREYLHKHNFGDSQKAGFNAAVVQLHISASELDQAHQYYQDHTDQFDDRTFETLLNIALADFTAGRDPHDFLKSAKSIIGVRQYVDINHQPYPRVKLSDTIDLAIAYQHMDLDPNFFLESASKILLDMNQDGYHADDYRYLALGYAYCGNFDLSLKELQKVPITPLEIHNYSYNLQTYSEIAHLQAEAGDFQGALATAMASKSVDVYVRVCAESALSILNKGGDTLIAEALITKANDNLDLVPDAYRQIEIAALVGKAASRVGNNDLADTLFSESIEHALSLPQMDEEQIEQQSDILYEVGTHVAQAGYDARKLFETAINASGKLIANPETDSMYLILQGSLLTDLAVRCAELGYFDLAKRTLELLKPRPIPEFVYSAAYEENWAPEKAEILAKIAQEEAKRGLTRDQVLALDSTN